MAIKTNVVVAVAAVKNKTGVELSAMEKEAASKGSEEIIITIRNGTAVKFAQSVYYPSLECVNGDGI